MSEVLDPPDELPRTKMLRELAEQALDDGSEVVTDWLRRRPYECAEIVTNLLSDRGSAVGRYINYSLFGLEDAFIDWYIETNAPDYDEQGRPRSEDPTGEVDNGRL